MARFYISTWHGEGGTIARVLDRQRPLAEAVGQYSTMRHGAGFRHLAEVHRDRLNRKERKSNG